MGNQDKDQGNKIINRRSMARLFAVQALYQMEMTGIKTKDVINEFIDFRIDKGLEGEQLPKSDQAFFKDLVEGVVEKQKNIDPLINEHLAQGWQLTRIDPIVRSVLRAGTYEMQNKEALPPAVIITEYINVTNAFLDPDHEAMVHAILDKISQNLSVS